MSYRNGFSNGQGGGGGPRGGASRPPNRTTQAVYVNEDEHSPMHYPPVSALRPQPKSSPGQDWSLPRKMTDRSALATIKNPIWPLRKSFSVDTGKKVLTNHFTFKLTTDKIYEYTILGFPDKAGRKAKKELTEKAVNTWPFLRDNQEYFATTSLGTIVSWKPLHDNLSTEISKDFSVKHIDENDERPFWTGRMIWDGESTESLDFKFVQEFSLTELHQYSLAHPGGQQLDFVNISRCLNIIVSKSLNADVHKHSANKFYIKSLRMPLGNSKSLEVIRGYFYNIKPGMGNLILNFNIATSAFFRPMLVSEFLEDSGTFSSTDELRLLLKKLRVWLEFPPKTDESKKAMKASGREKKIFCFQSDGVIGDLTFQKERIGADGRKIVIQDANGKDSYETDTTKVIDHLQTVYGRKLNPALQAVNVGSKDKPVWYSQELLRIMPYQVFTKPVPEPLTSSMVQAACRSPQDSRALIETEGLKSLGFVSENRTSFFNLRSGIPVEIFPSMLRVSSQTLPFPQVYYQIPAKKRASRWDIQNKFLSTRAHPFKYTFLKAPEVDTTSPKFYEDLLRQNLVRCGFDQNQALNGHPDRYALVKSLNDSSLEVTLQAAKKNNLKLVILVLSRFDRAWYCKLKDTADRKFGIHTICIVERHDKTDTFYTKYLQNISMKVNLKFGGVNHTALAKNEQLTDTMLLGADLIHAATGTIAAVVGSVDPTGGKCLGSVRLQDVHEVDREIIYTLEDMVYERLMHYKALNSPAEGPVKLPTKIIFYRDGVSSGHYGKLKEKELKAVHSAYARARRVLKLEPKLLQLTAVVVTKRHHTRFYPLPGEPGDRFGNGNTLPGTSVDRLVTSPYYQDFFLQSHSGIKGTAKPTHYFVLEDGIPGLKLEGLRDLTHKLCYSYARATVPVSYASLTYYADRLCERAAIYVSEICRAKNLATSVPWTSGKIIKDGRIQRDDRVVAWFADLEKHFYQHRDVEKAPVWGKHAPWHAGVADTMFWL